MASGRGPRSDPAGVASSRRGAPVARTGAPNASRTPPATTLPGQRTRPTATRTGGVRSSVQDVTQGPPPSRSPAGLAAKLTELLPQNAQAAAEAAWHIDLKALFAKANQMFPDVAWTTPSSSSQGLSAVKGKTFAHRAMISFRTTDSFVQRYLDLQAASLDAPVQDSLRSVQAVAPRSGDAHSKSKGASTQIRPSHLRKSGVNNSRVALSRTPSKQPVGSVTASSTKTSVSTNQQGDFVSPLLMLKEEDISRLKRSLKYIYTACLDGQEEELSEDLSLDLSLLSQPLDVRLERLRADMLQLWKSRQYSDITLRVGTPDVATGGSVEASPRMGGAAGLEQTAASIALPMADAEEEELLGAFAAHRAILVSRSPYFASHLLSSFSDANATDIQLPMPPFTPSALYFTLGFLYTGRLDFSARSFDLTIAFQIWRVATYLQVSSLTTVVSSLIYHDFCHRFGCSPPCALCLKRVPRTLVFAAAPDVYEIVLIESAKRTLSGRHFGVYWAREVGSLPSHLRASIVESIKRTINLEPGACIWALRQIMEVSTRLEGTRTHKWTENLSEMTESVEQHIKLRLQTTLEDVIGSEEWSNLVTGVGLLTDVLERMLNIIVSTLTEKTAVDILHLLTTKVLKGGDGELEAGIIRDKIQECRHEVLQYVQKRWLNIKASGGFNKLQESILNEIANAVDVMPGDLMSQNDPQRATISVPSKGQGKPPFRKLTLGKTAGLATPPGAERRFPATSRPSMATPSRDQASRPAPLRNAPPDRNVTRQQATPLSKAMSGANLTSTPRLKPDASARASGSTTHARGITKGHRSAATIPPVHQKVPDPVLSPVVVSGVSPSVSQASDGAPDAGPLLALEPVVPSKAPNPSSQMIEQALLMDAQPPVLIPSRAPTPQTTVDPPAVSGESADPGVASESQRESEISVSTTVHSDGQQTMQQTPTSPSEAIASLPVSPKRARVGSTAPRIAMLAARFSGEAPEINPTLNRLPGKLPMKDSPSSSPAEGSAISQPTKRPSPTAQAPVLSPTVTTLIPVTFPSTLHQRSSLSSPPSTTTNPTNAPIRATSVTNLLATRASVRRQGWARAGSFTAGLNTDLGKRLDSMEVPTECHPARETGAEGMQRAPATLFQSQSEATDPELPQLPSPVSERIGSAVSESGSGFVEGQRSIAGSPLPIAFALTEEQKEGLPQQSPPFLTHVDEKISDFAKAVVEPPLLGDADSTKVHVSESRPLPMDRADEFHDGGALTSDRPKGVYDAPSIEVSVSPQGPAEDAQPKDNILNVDAECLPMAEDMMSGSPVDPPLDTLSAPALMSLDGAVREEDMQTDGNVKVGTNFHSADVNEAPSKDLDLELGGSSDNFFSTNIRTSHDPSSIINGEPSGETERDSTEGQVASDVVEIDDKAVLLNDISRSEPIETSTEAVPIAEHVMETKPVPTSTGINFEATTSSSTAVETSKLPPQISDGSNVTCPTEDTDPVPLRSEFGAATVAGGDVTFQRENEHAELYLRPETEVTENSDPEPQGRELAATELAPDVTNNVAEKPSDAMPCFEGSSQSGETLEVLDDAPAANPVDRTGSIDEPRTPKAFRTLQLPPEEMDATPRNKPSFHLHVRTKEDGDPNERTVDASRQIRRTSKSGSGSGFGRKSASTTKLSIGIPCIVWPSLPGTPLRLKLRAFVKYIGPVDGYESTMVGVEIPLPLPESVRALIHLFNEGSIDGKEYFSLGAPLAASDRGPQPSTSSPEEGQEESLLSAHLEMMARSEREDRKRRIEHLCAHARRALTISPGDTSAIASGCSSPVSSQQDGDAARSPTSVLKGLPDNFALSDDERGAFSSDGEHAADAWRSKHDRRSASSSALVSRLCPAAVRSASSSHLRASRTRKRHSAQIRNLVPFPSGDRLVMGAGTVLSSPAMTLDSRQNAFGSGTASESDVHSPSGASHLHHRPSFTGSLHQHYHHRRPSVASSFQSIGASTRLLSPSMTGESLHYRSGSRSSSRQSCYGASMDGSVPGVGLFVTPEQVLWVFDDL